MVTRSIKKWAAPEPEYDDSPKSENGMCMCYGCPMPGSFSGSTAGSVTDWMCASHFRAQAGNWAAITHRYKQNQRMVDLIIAIRNSQSGKPFNVRGWLISLNASGDKAYLPNDDDRRKDGSLSMRKWQSRLEKKLNELVTSGLSEEVQNDGTSTPNSIEIMNIAEEYLKKFKLEEPMRF